MYSNGAVVSPNGVGYEFLIGTEYLLTLAGTGIDGTSRVELFDKQAGGLGVTMSWETNRLEYLVDGYGRSSGSQNLEARIRGSSDILANIAITWTESNAPVGP